MFVQASSVAWAPAANRSRISATIRLSSRPAHIRQHVCVELFGSARLQLKRPPCTIAAVVWLQRRKQRLCRGFEAA